MNHLRENHWTIYKCPFGCDSTFPSISECKDHLAKSHSHSGATAETDGLVKLATQSANMEAGHPCPFCNKVLNSTASYQSHVGRHQRQLSLFALPSLESNDGPDQDEDDHSLTQSTDSEDRHMVVVAQK